MTVTEIAHTVLAANKLTAVATRKQRLGSKAGSGRPRRGPCRQDGRTGRGRRAETVAPHNL